MLAVRLNADEAFIADCLAERRNALNNGDKNFPDLVGKRLLQHRAACRSEIAIAKHYGRYWTGCGKGVEGHGDVGGRWEVRAILSPDHGLIVREGDEERPHILVYVDGDVCQILGWAWASEVRQDQFFRPNSPQGDTPFWLMPQAHLRQVD